MTKMRNLLQLLSGRGLWATLMGLGFCVVLALNIQKVNEEREANAYLMRTNAWTAWQLEREYLRFLSALRDFHHQSTKSDFDDLLLRFDILYSRPQVVLVGPEAALVRAMPGVREKIQALIDTLELIEPKLLTLRPEDTETLDWIFEALAPFAAELSRISVSTSRGAVAERLRKMVEDARRKSIWMQALLVIASVLVMLFLTVEVARNRRMALNESRLRIAADEANRALKESEHWHRHLVESTQAIPYRLDIAARRLTHIGPQAERLGYANADWLTSRFWVDHLHPDDRETTIRERRRAIAARDDVNVEYRMLTADGQTVWLRDVMKVVREPNGYWSGYGLLFDITDLKQRDQELAAAQKMEAVGQLTGGIAHDFNNLLTIIIGNLEILGMDLESDRKAKGLVERATRAALRGADLTRQLLGFARRQALDPTDIDVNALITGTTELLSRTLGEQIEIETRLSADRWPTYVDPVQLESALTNLAINARDAMPNGGRITIETANTCVRRGGEDGMPIGLAPGDYVMLSISDTGCGIPPEVLPRVFEPFFTTKPHGKGTGLGLSMVFGFVSQSKGRVTIESAPGQGTTIRLYLPRGRARPRASEAATGFERAGSFAGAAVLVVEDNADVRQAVVAQLADLGCHVIEADSARAGLEIVESGRPLSLLFTDIVMPGGMSGIDLVERARRRRPDLKVLFTSGYYDDAVQGDRRLAEFGEMLRKPYRKDELLRKVGLLLADWPRRVA